MEKKEKKEIIKKIKRQNKKIGGGQREWQEIRKKQGLIKERQKGIYVKNELKNISRFRRLTPPDGHCTYHSIIRAIKTETNRRIEYDIDKVRRRVIREASSLYEDQREELRGQENEIEMKNFFNIEEQMVKDQAQKGIGKENTSINGWAGEGEIKILAKIIGIKIKVIDATRKNKWERKIRCKHYYQQG